MERCFPLLFQYSNLSTITSPIKHQHNNLNTIIPNNDTSKNKEFNSNNSVFSCIQTNSIFNDKNLSEYTNLFSENFEDDYFNKEYNFNFHLSSFDLNSLIHKKRKNHGIYRKDNIKRKILANYFKFLTNLINKINRYIFKNEKNSKNIIFLPITYNFKQNKFNKNKLDLLKKKSIGEIFIEYVVNKKKNSKQINEEVLKYITEKSNLMKKIIDEKCFEFFNIYYKNEKTINLSKYGENIIIILSDSKFHFFEDLYLSKNEKYYKKMIECIKEEYLKKPIFRCKTV